MVRTQIGRCKLFPIRISEIITSVWCFAKAEIRKINYSFNMNEYERCIDIKTVLP